MRKRQPNDVVAALQSDVQGAMRDWAAVRGHIGETGPLAKRATIDAFTRIATSFEGFRSNWHIAAINRDSERLKVMLEAEAVALVKESRFPGLASRVRIDLPTHPSLDLIHDLLDPQGRNLSIRSYKDWKARAAKELCDPWQSKINSMHNLDRDVMRAVIAIRNVLAHDSVQAGTNLNRALDALPASSGLKRGSRKVEPSGLGAYLNADVGGTRRIEIYATRLDALGTGLVVR